MRKNKDWWKFWFGFVTGLVAWPLSILLISIAVVLETTPIH